MNQPFISCICPTYKRPRLLQNALACFLAQDYPEDRRELIICDDAAQYDSQEGPDWKLQSTDLRYPGLPHKYNAMIAQARGDVIAIWEDDDIFLPWHLSDVAKTAGRQSSGFYVSKKVWSTYKEPFGNAHIEAAAGLFHSSWRFTRNLFEQVGGYPENSELSFDQQFGALLRDAANGCSYYGFTSRPGYVYRWGNNYWHGSQRGGEGYTDLWQAVGQLPAPKQGRLRPRFDAETRLIYNQLHANKVWFDQRDLYNLWVKSCHRIQRKLRICY